eukprot:5049473-Pyramimonas_sp.AAC.1
MSAISGAATSASRPWWHAGQPDISRAGLKTPLRSRNTWSRDITSGPSRCDTIGGTHLTHRPRAE